MTRRAVLALSIAALWIAPVTAHALSLSVTAPATVDVGSAFALELHVLGAPELGDDYGPPSVRAFDFDLSYDDSLLAYESTTFAEFLGWPGSQSIVSASDLGGVVDLKEVSLLSGGVLDASQPQDFLLATLSFEAIAPGSLLLELTQRDLSDVSGSRLAVSGSNAASIQIVPEPATGLLLAGGALLLALARRRSTRMCA
jgi:hypothetical protein